MPIHGIHLPHLHVLEVVIVVLDKISPISLAGPEEVPVGLPEADQRTLFLLALGYDIKLCEYSSRVNMPLMSSMPMAV